MVVHFSDCPLLARGSPHLARAPSLPSRTVSPSVSPLDGLAPRSDRQTDGRGRAKEMNKVSDERHFTPLHRDNGRTRGRSVAVPATHPRLSCLAALACSPWLPPPPRSPSLCMSAPIPPTTLTECTGEKSGREEAVCRYAIVSPPTGGPDMAYRCVRARSLTCFDRSFCGGGQEGVSSVRRVGPPSLAESRIAS